MAVVIAILAISVAAIGIEAAAMREHHARHAKYNNDGKEKYQVH